MSRERERERRRDDGAHTDPLLGYEESKAKMSDRLLVALVAIAAIVGFTDLTFNVQSLLKFSALTAFLYCLTTVTYRNRYDHGKLKGKNDPDYREAAEGYQDVIESIPDFCTEDMILAYCERYKERELFAYRRDLLMPFRIEEKEYQEKYLDMRFWQVVRLKKSWKFRCTILKCNRAKPIPLTPTMILNESGDSRSRRRALGPSGKQREKRDKRKQALSRAIVSFGGGAIAVSLIFDFSWHALAQWAVRILPIVAAIINGDSDGYDDIAVTEAEYKRDQTKFIKRMVEDIKRENEKKPVDCENDVMLSGVVLTNKAEGEPGA